MDVCKRLQKEPVKVDWNSKYLCQGNVVVNDEARAAMGLSEMRAVMDLSRRSSISPA